MVGLVPKSLGRCLRGILEAHAEGEGKEVCTWRHGAKMGIGKNRGCECIKCRVRRSVEGEILEFKKRLLEASLGILKQKDQWRPQGSPKLDSQPAHR